MSKGGLGQSNKGKENVGDNPTNYTKLEERGEITVCKNDYLLIE